MMATVASLSSDSLCMHKTGWTCQDAMRPLRNLATTGRFQQARPSLRALWDGEQSQAFLQTVYVYIRQVGPFRTRRDLCRISRPLAVSNNAHTTTIHTTKTLSISRCFSLFLAVSRCLLLSLAVSHCLLFSLAFSFWVLFIAIHTSRHSCLCHCFSFAIYVFDCCYLSLTLVPYQFR